MTLQVAEKDEITLRKQTISLLLKLPAGELQSAFDYIRYLYEREGWEATWELEAIPGFNEALERIREQIKKGDVVNLDDLDTLLAGADDQQEDELLFKSGLLPHLIAEANQENPDPDWEQTLDEL